MSDSIPSETEVLEAVLKPLLEDFVYWFERSLTLLKSERIDFLTEAEQKDLLTRISQAHQQAKATQTLFQATDGQAGVDTAVIKKWHRLVAEGWQVSIRHRLEHPEET
ncbi:MAG: DUF2605 domain-containing protein [Leptolyngbya sp. SIO4C5]|uniref:DUF2605 domain-containing protein n=1 Tax=Sphaerothrix gracilis TaxID=3151835 RepID=UPI0013C10B45|nr:DUF2605 domain-containing protein [Leptolyngbya sp. SIO4C5]